MQKKKQGLRQITTMEVLAGLADNHGWYSLWGTKLYGQRQGWKKMFF